MNNVITIGSRVALETSGRVKCYEIVASNINPTDGRISFQSPLGRALLGRNVGDKVSIKTPSNAVLEAEVIEIWPAHEYEVLIF